MARSDPVAGLGYRLDERWIAELGPQPADRDLDGVGERIRLLVPDALKQLLGGHEPALRGQQQLEDTKLLVGEPKLHVTPPNLPLRRVQHQIRMPQYRRVG